MTALLQTSAAFASAMAHGADWREVGRKLLEALESIRTENDGMNLGFIYATQELNADLVSLLALLKNVSHVQHWYGATGQGICGNGISIAEKPAAVAMIGKMPPGSFQGFTLQEGGALPATLRAWLANHTPGAAITHGILCAQAATRLTYLRERDGIYAVGGFAGGSQRGSHITDSIVVRDEALSGVLLDSNIRIMTATSFGCINAGVSGRITKCTGNVIHTIDDKPAFDFLRKNIDTLELEAGTKTRQGHVHAAFPVSGIDTSAFLVRNITDANEKSGDLTIAHHFTRGDAVQFVYRDQTTTMRDMSQVLTGLYARASSDLGAANLKPKALLYFGCGARLPVHESGDEPMLIKRIFGDIPMAGFYTAAEICNGLVYGYTGVIILFL